MPETIKPPMCPGCSESNRVVRGEHSAGLANDDLSAWWCNRCCSWLSAATRRRGRHTADFDVPLHKPAPQVNNTPRPDWSRPSVFSLTLQDGTKVEASWDPRQAKLRLHGPFGAVVEAPFIQTDGANLESCVLARAAKAWLDHQVRFAGEANPNERIGTRATGETPEGAARPGYKATPDPAPGAKSPAMNRVLAKLGEHPARWVFVNAIVGRALLKRGLVESRPRPKGSRGQCEYRLALTPGPYRMERYRVTLVEQQRIDDGETVPLWRILDTRLEHENPGKPELAEDSAWIEEEDCWAECDRLNRKAT